MPRKAPKLNLGLAVKGNKPRATKAQSRRKPVSDLNNPPKETVSEKWRFFAMNSQLFRSIISFVFLVLFLAWLGAFVYAVYDGLTVKSTTVASGGDRQLLVGLDKRRDQESVEVTVSKIDSAVEKTDEANLQAPKQEPLGIDAQFSVQDSSKFDDQFLGTSTNSESRKKVRASQLGVASVLPSFSVDKQPARQVGLSLDLVYNELRGVGGSSSRPISSTPVPFGGSEYFETMRQAAVAA